MKKISIIALIIIIICIFCSCSSQEYTIPEEGMVFDYYTAPVAVVGDAIYYEITIDKDSDGQFYLNVYTGDRDKGTTLSQETYKTTQDVLTDVMEVVKDHKMRKWNDINGFSVTGEITVVKFMGNNDEMIRVTSENMPSNGEAAFNKIYGILSSYLSTAEKIN